MRRVYFDHQAATPPLPEVIDAMTPWIGAEFGNPSSLHEEGLRARDALAEARARVARFIAAEAEEEVIFTSDGTESINLAIKGAAWANQRRGSHIILSATEHPAVLQSVAFLERHGFNATRVAVDGEGRLSPEAVAAAMTDKTILICAHHVNHEIGTVQPVAEIARLAREKGVLFFLDADASAGWLPVEARALGADLVSFSPQRFHGPKGVGVLYRRRRVRLESLLHGGAQENGRRAGVENMAAIVGAGVACEMAARDLSRRAGEGRRLQERLWNGLRKAVDGIQLNGPAIGAGRSPVNLNFSAPETEGEGLALICDTRGVALASGSGCVTKSLKPSHVLEAIGLDNDRAKAAVILSLGQGSTEEEADYFLEVFPKAVERLRAMSPANPG